MSSNPFAGLFTNVNDAVSFATQDQDETEAEAKPIVEVPDKPKEPLTTDDLLAEVFGITIHNEKKGKVSRQLLFIESDSIDQAIFERLLLTEPQSKLLTKGTKVQCMDKHVVSTDIFIYLFDSYCRLQKFRIKNIDAEVVENVQQIIIRNASTALQEPSLFGGQKVSKEFKRKNISNL